MSSAEQLLLVLFGVLCGFVIGHLTAWRFARKLELHHVALRDWDVPVDFGSVPRARKPLDFRSQDDRGIN